MASLGCARVPEEIARQLSGLEKRVLLALRERDPATPEEILAAGGFRELVEVMNAASWLRAKGLVTMRERIVRTVGLARRESARHALPERRALRALAKAGGTVAVEGLRSRTRMDEREMSVALGWMVRKGWADVGRKATGPEVSITTAGRTRRCSLGSRRPISPRSRSTPASSRT